MMCNKMTLNYTRSR